MSSYTNLRSRPAWIWPRPASACSGRQAAIYGHGRAPKRSRSWENRDPLSARPSRRLRLGGSATWRLVCSWGPPRPPPKLIHQRSRPTGQPSGRCRSLGVRWISPARPWGSLAGARAPARHAGADQFIDRTHSSARSAFRQGGAGDTSAFFRSLLSHICRLLGRCGRRARLATGPASLHRRRHLSLPGGPAFSTRGRSNLYQQLGLLDVIA